MPKSYSTGSAVMKAMQSAQSLRAERASSYVRRQNTENSESEKGSPAGSFKITVPGIFTDAKQTGPENMIFINDLKSASSVYIANNHMGSRRLSNSINNGMYLDRKGTENSKNSYPMSLPTTLSTASSSRMSPVEENLEDLEQTLKIKMNRMGLGFRDRTVEQEYEQFFLSKNIVRWRRNVFIIFFSCTTLFLYVLIRQPFDEVKWRGLYSVEDKLKNNSTCSLDLKDSVTAGLNDSLVSYNDSAHLLDTSLMCPHGWFCATCDPDILCNAYFATYDVILWAIGVFIPCAAALYTSFALTKLQFGHFIHIISSLFTTFIAIVAIFIRFSIVETNTPLYQPAYLGIIFTVACFIFLKVRFIYSLFSGFIICIAFISVFGTRVASIGVDSIPVVGVSLKTFCVSFMALSILIAIVAVSCFDTEIFYRGQFLVSHTLQKHNAKLTNQLKVLQKVYNNKAADFDSPLEKSVMLIRAMMADPSLKPQHLMELSHLLTLLGSSNLLAPDLEAQITEFMDTEQEAWLFSEIAPRRRHQRRTSVGQVQRQRRSSYEPQNRKIAETINEVSTASFPVEQNPSMTIPRNSKPGGQSPILINHESTHHQSVAHSPSQLLQIPRPSPFTITYNEIIDLPKVPEMLSKCGEFNWPIFDFVEAAGGRSLSVMAYYLFQRENLFSHFQIPVDRFWRFILTIEQGYHADIPYHNAIHACDVLHCISHLCMMELVVKMTTEIDILALYLAAIVHDYDHPGVNNNFLVNTYDSRTILYNDKSVLENHHLASAFSVLNKTDNNFLIQMPRSDFKSLRETVIEMVLATDLSQHFVIISSFKNKLAQNFDPDDMREDRILLWKMLMKCSDVSNPTKEWSLYEKWCRLILEEFMRQGDMEKKLGIPVSPYMDRDNINVPSSQIGFIEYVIMPLFDAYDKYIAIPHIIQHLRRNREHWVNLKSLNVVHMASVVPPPPLVMPLSSSSSVGRNETSISSR